MIGAISNETVCVRALSLFLPQWLKPPPPPPANAAEAYPSGSGQDVAYAHASEALTISTPRTDTYPHHRPSLEASISVCWQPLRGGRERRE